MLENLKKLGVKPSIAQGLVDKFPDRVAVQLRALWSRRKIANVPGFIVAAVQENYPLPVELQRIPEADRAAVSIRHLDAVATEERQRADRAKAKIAAEQQAAADDALLRSLPDEMRRDFEASARREFDFMRRSSAFDAAVRQGIIRRAQSAQLGGAR